MSNPYRALAAAVILQAVADYRELRTFLKTHKPDESPVWLAWRIRSAVRELREIEAFFLSEWYRTGPGRKKKGRYCE
ncbi:MAG: hypothetical protein PHZ09_08695 [Eubacteriales bacterium]|nr:hypothetical protein [Eubacteriales bacterium]